MLAWYAVHTKPREESRAAARLAEQNYEVFLPTLRIEKIRRGKADWADEVMFPRYLFIRLDNSLQGKTWGPIRSTPGVSRLVAFGQTPVVVPDGVVALLQDRQAQAPSQPMFEKGQAVEIVAGPFAGLAAVFEMRDAQQRAIVLLEAFGKMARLPMPVAALRATS